MSLARRLSVPPVSPAKQYCEVGKLLASIQISVHIDDEALAEYDALSKALSSQDWSSSALQEVLAGEGFQIPVRHLREHRMGRHTAQNCAKHDVGLL